MRIYLLSILLLTGSLFAQELEKAKTINAKGCVSRGVETGCFVLRDMKTGIVYDLRWSGEAPEVGQGITIVATPSTEPSTCMQGSTVLVQKWTAEKLPQCQAAEKSKS